MEDEDYNWAWNLSMQNENREIEKQEISKERIKAEKIEMLAKCLEHKNMKHCTENKL